MKITDQFGNTGLEKVIIFFVKKDILVLYYFARLPESVNRILDTPASALIQPFIAPEEMPLIPDF